MKIRDIFIVLAGISYYLWAALALLGGIAAAASVIIFPYGALPVLLFAGILLYYKLDDTFQKVAASKLRSGITEYPLEASMHLEGDNENKISFTKDGKSIELTTMTPSYIDFETPNGIRNYLKDKLKHLNSANPEWVDYYIVSTTSINKKTGELTATITMPDNIVLSKQYIEHEIKNVGRVFKRNYRGNSIRWLQPVQGERKLLMKNGRLLVYIDRKQIVPSFFDSKVVVMSERQITRNIKNRLWNRADIKCISINNDTYCGEIVNIKR